MPDFSLENALRKDGFFVIAGIDEAGRGPLAGPVMAGAVILPVDYKNSVLNDSKKLSGNVREGLYEDLISAPKVIFSSARVDSGEIDEINILQATWRAMAKAFEGLKPRPDVALIDGKPVKNFPARQKAVIKGDSLSLSIAAASIVAKVERDRIMLDYAKIYPEYGFERHKGYGTKAHLDALAQYGPCPIHRFSFAPVARVSGIDR